MTGSGKVIALDGEARRGVRVSGLPIVAVPPGKPEKPVLEFGVMGLAIPRASRSSPEFEVEMAFRLVLGERKGDFGDFGSLGERKEGKGDKGVNGDGKGELVSDELPEWMDLDDEERAKPNRFVTLGRRVLS